MAHQRWFTRLANAASRFAGSPSSFVLALLVVLVWIITGPLFGFSDTWQLVINTGTTIVTFLMVFLIQSSQNRDARRAQQPARPRGAGRARIADVPGSLRGVGAACARTRGGGRR
jgi:uncharacterized membrane protein